MLSQCISALALVLPSWKFYSLPHQFTTNGLVGVINITATRASRGNNSNAAFIRTLSEFRPCAKAMNSCFFFPLLLVISTFYSAVNPQGCAQLCQCNLSPFPTLSLFCARLCFKGAVKGNGLSFPEV